MEILILVGLVVCYIVQRQVQAFWLSIALSTALAFAAWVVLAFAFSFIAVHPMVPSGRYALLVMLLACVVTAFVVAGLRWLLRHIKAGAKS